MTMIDSDASVHVCPLKHGQGDGFRKSSETRPSLGAEMQQRGMRQMSYGTETGRVTAVVSSNCHTSSSGTRAVTTSIACRLLVVVSSLLGQGEQSVPNFPSSARSLVDVLTLLSPLVSWTLCLIQSHFPLLSVFLCSHFHR